MTQIVSTEDGLVVMLVDTMVDEKPMKTVISWKPNIAINVARDIIKLADGILKKELKS
jgi:hypothetical protein